MVTIDPQNGQYYLIYLSGAGWVQFQYDNDKNSFVSTHEIWRDFSGNVGYSAKKEEIHKDKISDYPIQLIMKGTIVGGLEYVPDIQCARLTIPQKGTARQAILDDPMALVLYNSIQGVLPFMDCMAVLTEAICQSQLSAQKMQLRKSEKNYQSSKQTQAILDSIRDSFFTKMIQSPWFGIVVALMAIIIAAIIAIMTIASAGAFAIFLTALVAVAIVAVVAAAVIGTSSLVAAHELAELKETFGDMDATVEKAFTDMVNYILNTGLALFVTIVLIAVAAAIGGYLAGSGFLSDQKKAEEKGKEMDPGSDVAAVVKAMGAAAKGAAAALKGAFQISSGIYNLALAHIEHGLALEAIKAEEWGAQSKYYTSLLQRFQTTLTGLWEDIERLYKSQSDLVKAAGEVSLAIVGNIAI